MIHNLIILGPPGSGKGTLAKKIAEEYDLEHVSTGKTIREELRNNNPEILKYKDVVEAGGLLPDVVVLNLIKERFEDRGNFILDGYPRTLEQAKLMDPFLKEHNIKISAVIYLDLDDDTIRERLSGRRECTVCGKIYNLEYSPPNKQNVCDACKGKLYTRKDDNPKAISKRLKIYHEIESPIVKFYKDRNLLHVAEMDGSIEENFRRIKKILDPLR